LASQTFYVPLPEEALYFETFKILNRWYARAPIISITSIAVSTSNTVIWYDHWEDGYDDDVANPKSSTTEIWGDGDASNGCAPTVSQCTDANDKLFPGDAILLENSVPIPRNKNTIRYDGGDRITASYPVAVTRGAYPQYPGSLMAGAIEVHDTSSWGTTFIAPVGQNLYHSTNAFEYTALYLMAAEDNTKVILPDSSTITLNQGESKVVRIKKQGEVITSDKGIQVDLLVGDINSTFELRWYSLIPVDQWSNEYVSPVGDTKAQTKVLLFNPDSKDLPISYEYLVNGVSRTATVTVGAKASALSVVIPSGSGAWFTSTNGGRFIALSLTDNRCWGQVYDWGYPLMPRDQLTSLVLIGWGYGCTGGDCGSHGASRSVVWITPVEDADIYVDYDNDGIPDKVVTDAKRLSSNLFADSSDDDMTGAIIFATSKSMYRVDNRHVRPNLLPTHVLSPPYAP
jgi:hypothetical protein